MSCADCAVAGDRGGLHCDGEAGVHKFHCLAVEEECCLSLGVYGCAVNLRRTRCRRRRDRYYKTPDRYDPDFS